MSFETVIALARDNGYGVVIVLAGTKNNLRDQSEDRLKKDLGIDAGGEHWYHLSNPANAQRTQIETKIVAWRRKPSKRSLLITVLKHGGHIEKLTDVLKKVNLDRVPALIIDDESDQASLNTQASRNRKNPSAAAAMSTTYEKILALRDVLPHHSYLQYTATPQANLLLAQTDLLNPTFSEIVTPGKAYTGGHAFFTEPTRLIEEIPIAEVPTSQVPLASPPKSLLKALRYFLLVAAHHSLTRQKGGLSSKDRNRSMMVHPAVATKQHEKFKHWVDRAFLNLKRRIENDHASKPAEVAALFQHEYNSLAKTFPGLKPLCELIDAMAEEVLDDLNCVEVNGTPDAERKVNWRATKYWILVGGAKLDRGYTVEGLCITYMPRRLGASPAADTLQQRARFFGYKKAYLGLCRVFVQASVRKAFMAYVEHEDFVRAALEDNRGKPLRDWRRDFILTQLLKPTRPNVVGLPNRRVLVQEWLVPKALHRNDHASDKNRQLLDTINSEWSSSFTRINAAAIATLAPARGPSPNDIIEAVPLTTVLSDFLLNLQVKDPGDAEQHSAMLVALSTLLFKDPSLKVDVFFMNQLKPGYRSRVATGSLRATDKAAPINQYFSQSKDSVNDRSFFTATRISLQLRRFDLGHYQRDSSKADIHNVTWYALYVPKRLKKALVVEKRT
jgi:hypothetical protein